MIPCLLVLFFVASEVLMAAEPTIDFEAGRVAPQPCGARQDAYLVAKWRAGDGACPGDAVTTGGVSIVEPARMEFAARSFTFEAWVHWPERTSQGFAPVMLAEARGGQWSWRFGLDELGCPTLSWQHGEFSAAARGQIGYDTLHPGRWYHVAVVFFDHAYLGGTFAKDRTLVVFYLTEAGEPLPHFAGMSNEALTPPPGPEAPAELAVGRGLESAPAAGVRIGSAAFHRVARKPANFPALGGQSPTDFRVDADFEGGSLSRAVQLGPNAVAFSAAEHPHCRNYWYAFRVRGAKGKTIRFVCPDGDAMMIAPYVSEDAGETWGRPNGATWRRPDGPTVGYVGLTHTFASDEAMIAGGPIATTARANAWIDQASERFGATVHTIGQSPQGRELRVVEIGNPDAPYVYMQAGQHSMAERAGFYLMARAFELAAGDAELLRQTRWMMLCVVNVDSYLVSPEPGDPNLNRVWRPTDSHPTTKAIRQFLEAQAKRTGALVAIDFHSGTVWRGHTILARDSAELRRFHNALKAEGRDFELRIRDFGAGGGPAPSFGGYALTLPGVRVACTIELALLASGTERGAVATTQQTLGEDGVRLYRALKRFAQSSP